MKSLLYVGVFILAASLVLAQEIGTEEVNAAGLLPSNPLWGLDVAFDRLTITFASDKAKARIEFLDERLSEMAVEEKEEAKTKSAIEYDVETKKFEGDSLSDSAVLSYEKHLERLQLLQAKLPEQARKGLAMAINNANALIQKKMAARLCSDLPEGSSSCTAKVNEEVSKLKQQSAVDSKQTVGGMSYGKQSK